MNKKKCRAGILLSFLSLFVASGARAVSVDFTTLDMNFDADGNTLSFDAGGVQAKVRGYHVEVTSGHPGGKIYGPFSTATAIDAPSWLYPYFGRITNKLDGSLSGLMLLSSQNLGQTDIDLGSAVGSPGFDNRSFQSNDIPTFQFALFEFSAPVSVSEVVMGNVSNNPHPFWVAGGNGAPDLGANFLAAFNGYEFRNMAHPDTQFAPIQGVRYLAIGAPPSRYEGMSDTTFGPLTVVGDSQFYIDGLDFTPVPLPAAVWLFGAGLLGLGFAGRARP